MIGALLCVQWLAAAYACPTIERQHLADAGAVVVEAAAADCHGRSPAAMDPANPSLCKVHCDGDHQAPSHAATDDAPATAPLWFIVEAIDPLDGAGRPAHQQPMARSGAPPGWPPLYLIHGVLRN